MRRRLHEAKADLELAIVKSLDRAPLTLTELQELKDLNVRDLMSDHELDYVLAEKVKSHVQHEALRLQAQNQQTPLADFESNFTSLTRSAPTAQRPLKLSEGQVRRLVRQMINEELCG